MCSSDLLDAGWEKAMRGRAKKILCIDDLANRAHDCDMLLDQNYYDRPKHRYAGLLPPGAITLLGPRYALLRPEFAFWRQRMRERDGTVKRILIFMGGSDSANVTCAALEALAQCGHVGLETQIDVVIGQANLHVEEVRALCARMHRVSLHRDIDNIAELMTAADLAIGATGASTWERAALGLPALAVSVAENQRDIARYAAKSGLLTWLGDAQSISLSEWKLGIDEACSSPEALRRQSRAGLALIDAYGVARVAEHML